MTFLFFVFELIFAYLSIGVFFFLGDDADLESEVIFCPLVVIPHLLQPCLKFLPSFFSAEHFTDSLTKSILLTLSDPTRPIGHSGPTILQFRDLRLQLPLILLKTELLFQHLIMLLSIRNIILFLFRVIIMQNNLNNLHRIVLHFLYLTLRTLKGLLSLVLTFSNGVVAVLKLVFFEVVVQVAEQVLAGLREVLKSRRLVYGCQDF